MCYRVCLSGIGGLEWGDLFATILPLVSLAKQVRLVLVNLLVCFSDCLYHLVLGSR